MEEHNLLDIPVINISENNKVNEYTMIHTTSGLPVYVPPDEKNNVEVFKIYEFVFLPITHHDFKHNTEEFIIELNSFFYSKIFIQTVNKESISFIDDKLEKLSKILDS